MDEDAAVDADPSGGGDLDEFQNQISGKVFSRLSQACTGGGVPHITAGESTCADLY